MSALKQWQKSNEVVDGETFLPFYRRRPPHTDETVKNGARRRKSLVPNVCSAVFVLSVFGALAVVGLVLAAILDRLQQLELRRGDSEPLYETFRSEHVECFHIDANERMFIVKPAGGRPDDFVHSPTSFADTVSSPEFWLSGFNGQLQLNVRLHESSREKYLYVKYRTVAGDHYPMHKRLVLRLLHPTNSELGLQKTFNTRDEIAMGAATFARPDENFFGANFCSANIIDRFVNNMLICVSVSITELISHN